MSKKKEAEKELLIVIHNESNQKVSKHLVLLKGNRIITTTDELIQIKDEIEFYLSTPAEMKQATGGKQK